MSEKKTIQILKKYKQAKKNNPLRVNYLRIFKPRMIYRTTKMENMGMARRLVRDVLKMLERSL
jgi:hypothetical protein